MKKIAAVFLALAMSFALVTPAFAAGLSSAEQNLLSKFKDELNYWAANAQLDQDHINQYYKEAESALTAVQWRNRRRTQAAGRLWRQHPSRPVDALFGDCTARKQRWCKIQQPPCNG